MIKYKNTRFWTDCNKERLEKILKLSYWVKFGFKILCEENIDHSKEFVVSGTKFGDFEKYCDLKDCTYQVLCVYPNEEGIFNMIVNEFRLGDVHLRKHFTNLFEEAKNHALREYEAELSDLKGVFFEQVRLAGEYSRKVNRAENQYLQPYLWIVDSDLVSVLLIMHECKVDIGRVKLGSHEYEFKKEARKDLKRIFKKCETASKVSYFMF